MKRRYKGHRYHRVSAPVSNCKSDQRPPGSSFATTFTAPQYHHVNLSDKSREAPHDAGTQWQRLRYCSSIIHIEHVLLDGPAHHVLRKSSTYSHISQQQECFEGSCAACWVLNSSHLSHHRPAGIAAGTCLLGRLARDAEETKEAAKAEGAHSG